MRKKQKQNKTIVHRTGGVRAGMLCISWAPRCSSMIPGGDAACTRKTRILDTNMEYLKQDFIPLTRPTNLGSNACQCLRSNAGCLSQNENPNPRHKHTFVRDLLSCCVFFSCTGRVKGQTNQPEYICAVGEGTQHIFCAKTVVPHSRHELPLPPRTNCSAALVAWVRHENGDSAP